MSLVCIPKCLQFRVVIKACDGSASFCMLWQVIPQPNWARKGGEEVGVDRGLKNLDIACFMSRRSTDWGEIIKRYVGNTGVGFMEVSKFILPCVRRGEPNPKFQCY